MVKKFNNIYKNKKKTKKDKIIANILFSLCLENQIYK